MLGKQGELKTRIWPVITARVKYITRLSHFRCRNEGAIGTKPKGGILDTLIPSLPMR